MRAVFADTPEAVGFAEILAELLDRRIYLFGNADQLQVSERRVNPMPLLEIFNPIKRGGDHVT